MINTWDLEQIASIKEHSNKVVIYWSWFIQKIMILKL